MQRLHFRRGYFKPFNGIKTPTIQQSSETECGIAALAILFSYYQVFTPLEVLRDQCGVSRDGCRASTLIEIAGRYGFEAEAYSVELDVVSQLTEPVIAYWNFCHYVVIEGVGKNRVFINDPAQGRVVVTMTEFAKAFTGVIITLSPTSNVQITKQPAVIRPFLNNWLLITKQESIFLFLCGLLVLSLPILNASLINVFINQVIIAARITWLAYLAGIGVVISMLLVGSALLQKWHQFKLCTKLALIKSSAVVTHVLQLPLLFFALRQKSDLMLLLLRVESVMTMLVQNGSLLLLNLASAAICMIVMLQVDRSLACLSISCTIVWFFMVASLIKLKARYEKSNLYATSKFYAHSVASIRNIETIKACGLERQTLEKWQILLNGKLLSQDKSKTMAVFLTGLTSAGQTMTTLLLLCFGGLRAAEGYLSIGGLLGFYSLHLYLNISINIIAQAVKDVQSAYVGHVPVNEVLKYNIEKTMTRHLQDKDHAYILAEQVYFSYNKTLMPTIKNINCQIDQGEHIALVGGSGSGKSTLAKLLCGLYEVQQGTITLEGQSLNSISQEQRARQFAYVAQDNILFSGTLYENLTLWRTDIPLTKIQEAIDDACLNELVDMRGLYAPVYEGGSNFSGGERQRIDIARALLQDTPILVLDEGTSALDIATEAKLIANLLRKNKTIIFVAHRLSTIRHCSQIMVIEDGAVVEKGRHSELFAKGGQYYQLIMSEENVEWQQSA